MRFLMRLLTVCFALLLMAATSEAQRGGGGFHGGGGFGGGGFHGGAPMFRGNPGFRPGFNPGFRPGFNHGFNPGFNHGFRPGFDRDFRGFHESIGCDFSFLWFSVLLHSNCAVRFRIDLHSADLHRARPDYAVGSATRLATT
jgi:hypothetical protein